MDYEINIVFQNGTTFGCDLEKPFDLENIENTQLIITSPNRVSWINLEKVLIITQKKKEATK